MVVEYQSVSVNLKNVTTFKIYKRNIVFAFIGSIEGLTFKFENEDEALKAFKLINNALRTEEIYLSLD